MENIKSYLSRNEYPGRGIYIGKSSDGKYAVIGYFIMGRSENSRNRIFTEFDGGIKTEAFEPQKLSDPSLIIYSPVRVLSDATIVTNGDQTDTVWEFMKEKKTFADALRTRCFEPDAPNFTPRISGVVLRGEGDFSYKLSILKSDEGRDCACCRYFYEYSSPVAGEGHIIHTYLHDGNPIPSFCGEPVRIKCGSDIDEFANDIWEGLNSQNKVSLFVRFINLENGSQTTKIINKNK